MVSLSVKVLVIANIGKILFIGLLLKTDRPFVRLASETIHVCCLDQQKIPALSLYVVDSGGCLHTRRSEQ